MIVELLEKNQVEKWSNPVIEQYRVQFTVNTDQAEKLQPDENENDISMARKLAVKLCDGSRNMVYRMHRVTPTQLTEIAEEFARAAKIIAAWKLPQLPESERELIRKYGEHVASRAKLLRSQLG